MANGDLEITPTAYPALTSDKGIYILVEAGKAVPPIVAAIKPGEGANIVDWKAADGKRHKVAVDHMATLPQMRQWFDLEREGKIILCTQAQLLEAYPQTERA